MQTKFLTIEGIRLHEKRGIIVFPKVPLTSYSGPHSRSVILRKPDGQERKATATFMIPFIKPEMKADFYVCTFADLTEIDTPVGTEIWFDEDAA